MDHHHRLLGCVVEGRYRILEHLADGGMGSVFVAEDERLKRQVALKILRPDLARDPVFVERFRREAQAAASLNDSHVVAVHDQGQDEHIVFLAMELVRPGRTLRDVIQAGGQRVSAALDTIDDAAAGLASAHRAGLVHRDVKPENVLISHEWQVKVADFGLARAVTARDSSTTSDALIGTAPYLAPEQVSEGKTDPRSDVYALGLVLFELLTGRRAFDGDSPVNIAYQHVHGTMPTVSETSPELGSFFDDFFTNVCAKEPHRRPQNADDFRTQLARLRADLPDEVLSLTCPSGPATMTSSNRTTHADDAPVPHHTQRVDANVTRHLPAAPSEPSRTVSRRVPLLVAGAVALAAVGGGIAYSQGVFSTQTTVPKVAGSPRGTAVSKLREADVHVKIVERHHDTVPPQRVVSVSPQEGARVERGGTVTLTVSTGPRPATVPDVHTLSYDRAKERLKQAGFSSIRRQDVYDKAAAGTILGTSPAAKSTVSHLQPVTIRVSKGPKEVDVPDVTDTDAASAKQTLEDLGFKVSEKKEYSSDVDSGDVISTDPEAGTTRHSGDTITLTVSKGVEQVEVPDVVGQKADDARSALKDAGFEVKGGSWTDELFNHTVTAQDPEGGNGKKAPKGSTVTLTY